MEPRTTRTDVKKLYSLAGGRWWDPYRAIWESTGARQAKRDLESLLQRYVGPNSRILDVGCGTGENLRRLLRLGLSFGYYTGLDFSESMLARASKRFQGVPEVTFSEADATSLKDTGERYEVIVSTWLLDHLREPAAFVNGVQRFLAPNGHLILLFYSQPRWFLDFWLSPLERMTVRADPVSRQEVSRFKGVLTRKTYCGGLATVVDIAPSGQEAHDS